MALKNINGLTVMVVDDYADTRRVVKWMLEQHGFRVVEAENGRQAVESSPSVRPDLILMDLSMPQLDGFDATRLIRESGELRGVPIIAVTAHDMAAFRDGAESAGCDYYLSKPIDFNRLMVLIEKLMTERLKEAGHVGRE